MSSISLGRCDCNTSKRRVTADGLAYYGRYSGLLSMEEPVISCTHCDSQTLRNRPCILFHVVCLCQSDCEGFLHSEQIKRSPSRWPGKSTSPHLEHVIGSLCPSNSATVDVERPQRLHTALRELECSCRISSSSNLCLPSSQASFNGLGRSFPDSRSSNSSFPAIAAALSS